MVMHPLPAKQAPTEKLPRCTAGSEVIAIGVGLDTSRYGHYAAFLDANLQQAAPELEVPESAAGYVKLRDRFQHIAQKYGRVHFHVRLDVAGAYADNLLHWLQSLNHPTADAARLAEFTISCGDPQRNKSYRVAIYGAKKSDPIEARACARYALTEHPKPMPVMSAARQRLRQVALRLQAVVKQRTRLANQLHQLLARAFPELAMLVQDISVGWVLELLTRYPTAQRLAQATTSDLQAIPYLPHQRSAELLSHARGSIGSLHGELADELVRDQVRQVRDNRARQKRLENLLISAYRDLPTPNHLDSIIGFGEVTAGILTAFVADIDQVHTPGQLVNYFGVLPIEVSSGVDRDGNPRGPKRYVMSRRGNDLVRRYLWMAALSAAQHNPACRALYARVVAKHPDKKGIAVGHVMRKLLHLAFAVWKTGMPFDPNHYDWSRPAHLDREAATPSLRSRALPVSDNALSLEQRQAENKQAAGLEPDEPAMQEVTAACTSSIPHAVGNDAYLDFSHLKKQLPMSRVLDHLGLTPRLKGSGPQKRCACPIHRGDGRGRTFSVNLDHNVFSCHAATCKQQGDVIDLWAALYHQKLREAALDLARTFNLEPVPRTATEKRHG